MSESSNKDNGGQAFPSPDIYHPNGQIEYGAPGMTFRQYAAVAAMQGCLANPQLRAGIPQDVDLRKIVALSAVQYADALIEELKQ